MAAHAEISISEDVYDHVQRQSLAFHLNRETGKIIRIVSKGGTSFTSTMRMMMFSLGPIIIEIIMTLIVFGTLFDWRFLIIELASIVIYIGSTYYLTESRAKDFKAQTLADQNYN